MADLGFFMGGSIFWGEPSFSAKGLFGFFFYEKGKLSALCDIFSSSRGLFNFSRAGPWTSDGGGGAPAPPPQIRACKVLQGCCCVQILKRRRMILKFILPMLVHRMSE